MKQVTVCMSESGKLLDRTIAPGTTAADLLRDIGLPNGLLSKSRDGEFLANADTVYDKITDGQKLFASTPASVGSSFFENLISKAMEKFEGKYFPRPSEVLTMPGGASRRPRTIVQRQEIPYWQERGWKRTGWTYRGHFVTPYGAFTGRIVQSGFAEIEFYIQHPPEWIFNSSHAACFQARGKDWFFVHMYRRPKDVSSGIITIEHLLTDYFRTGGRNVSH
ncbi:MAG TPA: hypothetical protein VFR24_17300 [Candidatus Angelobacter sp.]|nr:hypothetical protein [Candidatus Angelobacter sp.]